MKIPKKYKKCSYCSHYFVNADFEKLCVDRVEVDGRTRIKVRDRLGIMCDRHSCEQFEPDEVTIRMVERERLERMESLKSRKENK